MERWKRADGGRDGRTARRGAFAAKTLPMNRQILALAATVLLGGSSLLAQGSGTTTTTTSSTKTKTTTATATKKSSYTTVKHVNGVVTARSANSITVKVGSKSRTFTINKSTRFVSTKGGNGAKVKVAYRSSAPGVAVEIRSRS